jgi:hypothetical protein
LLPQITLLYAEVAAPVVVDVQVHELVVLGDETAASTYQDPVAAGVLYFRILNADMVSRAPAVRDLHRVVDDVDCVDVEAVDDDVAVV